MILDFHLLLGLYSNNLQFFLFANRTIFELPYFLVYKSIRCKSKLDIFTPEKAYFECIQRISWPYQFTTKNLFLNKIECAENWDISVIIEDFTEHCGSNSDKELLDFPDE